MGSDVLLGMLMPLWQILIGLCVLGAVVVSVWRLGQRGPSRMSAALLVTGTAIVALAVIGVLMQ